MSQNYYTQIWKNSLISLKEILSLDCQVTVGGPYKEIEEVKQKIENLYLRYAVIANQLCEVSDEIRDPLIAHHIRKYYEITVSRVLQLNDELSRLHAANNLDAELIQLVLTPFDIRLKIPQYFSTQPKNFQAEKENNYRIKNQEIRETIKKEYEENCKIAENRVMSIYKNRITESIQDELRNWSEDFYEKCNEFPPFPQKKSVYLTGEIYGIPKKCQKNFPQKIPEDFPKNTFTRDFCGVSKLGGSALITADHWITTQEWIMCQKLSKQKKTTQKKKNTQQKKKPVNGFKMKETDFFSIVQFLENSRITPVSEFQIESNAFYKTGLEIRKEIDEIFQIELKLLEDALYKDKFPKRKKRKQKKEKKGKNKLHDSNNKSIEELTKTGIIRKGYGSRLENFTTDFDNQLIEMLLQRCILPLKSQAIHQLSPLTRSVCLIGPQNTGKKFLIDAVVTATGATVFDLSPEITTIYEKKEIKKLINAVQKLSRELQPSVIFIENIERLFYKKVAAKDKWLKPKLLQPYIRKLVKGIQASNQILLMATSSQPWMANRAKLIKSIDRFFYSPNTNYATNFLIWRKFLENSENVSALAKISTDNKYQYQQIKESNGQI